VLRKFLLFQSALSDIFQSLLYSDVTCSTTNSLQALSLLSTAVHDTFVNLKVGNILAHPLWFLSVRVA
jgi:hypothetical protein